MDSHALTPILKWQFVKQTVFQKVLLVLDFFLIIGSSEANALTLTTFIATMHKQAIRAIKTFFI